MSVGQFMRHKNSSSDFPKSAHLIICRSEVLFEVGGVSGGIQLLGEYCDRQDDCCDVPALRRLVAFGGGGARDVSTPLPTH